jgi:putative transposase
LKPTRQRQLVDDARSTWRVSIRRACRALPVERSTYHYRSRRAGQAQLSERIKEIAATRVRYGYRRIHVLLRREGWQVNAKRVYRLYREIGLQLRNKTPKRRVKAKLRDDRQPATRVNQTWAMDFVHDQLATGRKLRVLTIVDTFSRFSPAVEPRFNFRGADVVEVLERVGRQGGFPAVIRVDQGTEFVSRDLDLWAYQRGVTLDFSRPGKPTDNAFIESFNGKFRVECLNAHWFMSLDDACRKCEAWRRDYNERDRTARSAIKPRSSLSIDQWRTARPERNRPGKNPAGRSKDGEQFREPVSHVIGGLKSRGQVNPDQWAEDERLSRVGRSAQLDMRVYLAHRRGGFPRQTDRRRRLSAQDASSHELTRTSLATAVAEFLIAGADVHLCIFRSMNKFVN